MRRCVKNVAKITNRVKERKNMKSKIKSIALEGCLYLSVFLFSLICYVIFVPLVNGIDKINGGSSYLGEGIIAKLFCAFLLIILLFVFIMLLIYKKANRKLTIFVFILGSVIVRLCFVLSTVNKAKSGADLQYDTWGSFTHFRYAETIFLTGKLPNNNTYQFYHPPLNAIIQSGFMAFFEKLFGFINNHCVWLTSNRGLILSNESYYHACTVLSMVYVTVITVTAAKIFKELNVKGLGGLLACFFVIFFPRLIQFSGQLNNDVLCLMFSVLSVYYAIKFYKNCSWLNLILLALSIGLAMMTKLNGAIIALPIAILMVIVFVKQIKEKNTLNIIIKYCVFITICAPLGLWFSIYAKVRFNQEFGYVFSNLNKGLSTADVPLYNRFSLPSLKIIFKNPFARSWDDYNFIDYMTKSSMFGEFLFPNVTTLAYFSVILNYLFQISFVVGLVYWLINRIKKKVKIFDLSSITFLSILVFLIVLQIYFYLKMPYGCTMDFRYVTTLVIAYGGMSGIVVNESKEVTCLKGYKTVGRALAFCLIALISCTTLAYILAI